MKNLLVLIFVALGLAACVVVQAPPADQSSANKDPAQWQQFKSKKGVEELDANTK